MFEKIRKFFANFRLTARLTLDNLRSMKNQTQAIVVYKPIPDDQAGGPAMLALNPQQRAFVMAHIATGGQNGSAAAAAAGYGGDNPVSVRVTAHRLLTTPKVRAAIREVAETKINAQAAFAADVLVEIARDVTHKDRLKAANMIMDRSGMLVVQQVEHVHRPEDDVEKVRRIVALANSLGMDPRQLLGGAGVTLDADFEVVSTETPAESSAGLEDLL